MDDNHDVPSRPKGEALSVDDGANLSLEPVARDCAFQPPSSPQPDPGNPVLVRQHPDG